MKSINVVAGIFIDKCRVLAARRAPKKAMAGKWEFVGGKIEDGESPQTALRREVLEELGVICDPCYHFSTDATVVGNLEIILSCWVGELETTAVHSTDHDDSRWLTKNELWDVDWADADIPAVRRLENSTLLDF